MKLKVKLTQAEYDALTGEIKGNYLLHDGFWYLDLEENTGVHNALTAEREANRGLKEQLRAATEQLTKLGNPEELLKLRDDLAAGKFSGKTTEEVEKAVQERLKILQTDHAKEIEARDKKLGTLKTRLQESAIKAGLAEAGKGKIRPEALPDVFTRASAIFGMDDDFNVVATDRATGAKLFGRDGVTPYGYGDFVAKLTQEAPHLMVESQSGGLKHGQGQQKPGGTNQQGMSAVQRLAAARAEQHGGTANG